MATPPPEPYAWLSPATDDAVIAEEFADGRAIYAVDKDGWHRPTAVRIRRDGTIFDVATSSILRAQLAGMPSSSSVSHSATHFRNERSWLDISDDS